MKEGSAPRTDRLDEKFGFLILREAMDRDKGDGAEVGSIAAEADKPRNAVGLKAEPTTMIGCGKM